MQFRQYYQSNSDNIPVQFKQYSIYTSIFPVPFRKCHKTKSHNTSNTIPSTISRQCYYQYNSYYIPSQIQTIFPMQFKQYLFPHTIQTIFPVPFRKSPETKLDNSTSTIQTIYSQYNYTLHVLRLTG